MVDSVLLDEKKLLRQTKQVRQVKGFHNAQLQRLWTLANRYGLSVELAGFADEEWTQDHLDKLMDRMDRRGGNPFNYAELYDSVDHFVGELPYRSNLRGVVDVPGRVARYGSWGIELQNL